MNNFSFLLLIVLASARNTLFLCDPYLVIINHYESVFSGVNSVSCMIQPGVSSYFKIEVPTDLYINLRLSISGFNCSISLSC
jgi:hypothetical protein